MSGQFWKPFSSQKFCFSKPSQSEIPFRQDNYPDNSQTTYYYKSLQKFYSYHLQVSYFLQQTAVNRKKAKPHPDSTRSNCRKKMDNVPIHQLYRNLNKFVATDLYKVKSHSLHYSKQDRHLFLATECNIKYFGI